MALETELKKNTAAMERLAAALEAAELPSGSSADFNGEGSTDQAPETPKKTRGKAKAKKDETPKDETPKDETPKDETPKDELDPREVRKQVADYLSKFEDDEEAQTVRKNAVREALNTLQNPAGDRPKNASDLCADHRPKLLEELENIKAKFDGQGDDEDDV